MKPAKVYSNGMKNHGRKILMLSCAALAAFCLCVVLSSCGGYSEISRNTENLRKLRVGMDKQVVLEIMGEPLTKEIYNTPHVWYYYTRTQWNDGMNTRDECTPLVFDETGKLKGWGRDYYNTNYDLSKWRGDVQ